MDKKERKWIMAAIVAIILLILLWPKPRAGISNVIVNRNGGGLDLGDFNGDFSLGGIDVPGVTIPELSFYEQQSSCGCSVAEIPKLKAATYYSPAVVRGPTRNEITNYTIVNPPPPGPVTINPARATTFGFSGVRL